MGLGWLRLEEGLAAWGQSRARAQGAAEGSEQEDAERLRLYAGRASAATEWRIGGGGAGTEGEQGERTDPCADDRRF